MKVLFKAIALLSLFAAMSGCGSAPKYDLTDGQWVLSSWMNDEGDEMVLTANRPTLKFEADGKVYGNAGCNDFNGRYEIDGEKILIDLGAMTLKLCMDMEAENQMLKQIPNVVSFEIDGNQMILLDPGKKELFRFDNKVIEEEKAAE